MLDATSTTMFRSMITKNVHANEVGKVFSVVGTFQALMPFAAGPLFGFLYRETVESQPAAFLFLIASIKGVVFLVIIGVAILSRKTERAMEKDRIELEDLSTQEQMLEKNATSLSSS